VLRDYRADLERRVLPDLGARRINEIHHQDVQRLVDRMVAQGLSGSRVRNVLNSLRSVYRYAMSRERGVEVSPVKNLELPAAKERKRERIADPVEARALLAALREADRPVWACALFAGLRAGELRALRWQDVDLSAGTIRVEFGWDDVMGRIPPKSDSARRTVPIIGALRPYLVAHQLACGWSSHGPGLVLGRLPGQPFNDRAVTDRAKRAWAEAKLQPIGLHEARHSAASLFIAADVTPKQISTWLGHSSITITFDRYGHLFPNANEEGVAKVDAYLARTG
jgi:integrase